MDSIETPATVGVGSRVNHHLFGRGVIVDQSSETYTVWFKSQQGTRNVAKDFSGMKITEPVADTQAPGTLSIADIEEALETVLERRMHEFQLVPLGTRWEGGTLILQPKDAGLQNKEVPIETFFHKIVMLRDRLRLIEQKVNAHKGLSESEKLDMQQYITACYGTLTTFNILFKEQHHQFKGQSKD
ncbi:MAG: hypothetical protein JST27_11430 [Bacteroidetes bacterium]|nr:hypothetical protein [Bacteroidota bacterium]